MSRYLPVFLLCSAAAIGAVLSTSAAAQGAGTVSPQALAAARAACATDLQQFCAGVAPGGGRLIACLKEHRDQVSPGCKQAVQQLFGGASGSTPGSSPPPAAAPSNPAPQTPPTAQTTPAAPSAASTAATTAAKKQAHSASAATGKGERYFLMKQVTAIDLGQALGVPGKTAYTLMIPTTWQWKGAVTSGTAEGGCIADMEVLAGIASSADNSLQLQILPQYTFQYTDDPGAQRQMQQRNQFFIRGGLKPCPVRPPVHAADFLRNDLIAKYRKDKTVVSIDPYPELEQLARARLGLPVQSAAGNSGAARTEAARARLAFDDDQGKPVEEWWTAVMLVRTMPSGGRGAAYDWHAVNVMVMRAPKGQLDGNERLFKLIVNTLHADPQWQQASNNIIVTTYRKLQEETAKQNAIIAAFQQHVADTLSEVTANQVRGANQAAFGADQLIRGVQSFRDPTTGGTFELSNQYDHAWLNGANQYVMSDDPSFNPNGSLSGSWTQLQPVRPQP